MKFLEVGIYCFDHYYGNKLTKIWVTPPIRRLLRTSDFVFHKSSIVCLYCFVSIIRHTWISVLFLAHYIRHHRKSFREGLNFFFSLICVPSGPTLPMESLNWVTEYAAFAVMLGLSMMVGLYFGCVAKQQNTVADYLLGGRHMSVFPITMSLIARYIHDPGGVILDNCGNFFLITFISNWNIERSGKGGGGI